jgi:hypothetical protein
MRHVTGWLWRFVWFRVSVITLCRIAPRPVANWLALETPLAFSLRELFRERGDQEAATECSRALWRNGE